MHVSYGITIHEQCASFLTCIILPLYALVWLEIAVESRAQSSAFLWLQPSIPSHLCFNHGSTWFLPSYGIFNHVTLFVLKKYQYCTSLQTSFNIKKRKEKVCRHLGSD